MENLLYRGETKRLPFLQLNRDQFNELQRFSPKGIEKLMVLYYKNFPHVVQIGLKEVRQLDATLLSSLFILRSNQVKQLKKLPFPKVKEFLKLDFGQRKFLPFDLAQFKAYKRTG